MLKEIDGTITNLQNKLVIIVVVDICGYTSLMEENELLGLTVRETIYNLFSHISTNSNGRIFHTAGDGFVAEFSCARDSLDACFNLLDEIYDKKKSEKLPHNTHIRIGMHVGDVQQQHDGDLLGHTVNIAWRLQELANEDNVLASINLVNLIGQEFDYERRKRGNLNLKNIKAPIAAFDLARKLPQHSFGIKVTHFLKSLTRIQAIVSLSLSAACIFGFVFLSEHINQTVQTKFDKKIKNISDQYFQVPRNVDIPINSEYIRSVLSRLKLSNIESNNIALTLLESGYIDQAVKRLENDLTKKTFGSQKYIEQMHHIAALSLYNNSKKSISYYENILEIAPNDKEAMYWLFKAYHLVVDAEKAHELYVNYIEKQSWENHKIIQSQINLAFQHMLQQEFSEAVRILVRLRIDAEKSADRRLFIDWQTVLAYALFRTDNLVDAQAMSLATIKELELIGADTNMPRAYNILGQIFERKAELTPVNKNENLQQALGSYEKQYAYGLRLEKKRELAESNYFQGEVYISLMEFVFAKQKFIESLRLASEHDLVSSEFRSRLGLAHVEKLIGKQKLACRQARKAQKIFHDKMNIKLSKKILTKIDQLDCGLAF